MARCVLAGESGGNYRIGGLEPFGGAWQFDVKTWNGLGYSGLPDRATAATQDAAAFKLWRLRGWRPWPTTSAACIRRGV